MDVKFSRYDTADYLKTEEDIVAYLDAVMEDGDPALIAAAIGDVARARNFSQLARDVGISRQGLDKALSGKGNPSLATVVKVAKVLGLRLSFMPMQQPNQLEHETLPCDGSIQQTQLVDVAML